MISMREESLISNSRIGGPTSATWWYLSAEFIIALSISGLLTILGIIKTFLPKPPKDLTGEIVVITGVTSALGRNLAEEFAKNGCQLICIDHNLKDAKEIASDLRIKYPTVEKVGPEYRIKDNYHVKMEKCTNFAYECNLGNRSEINNVVKKVKDDFGGINILITCNGDSSQDIFDTITQTLMSHYWTVMAFIPLMLNKGRAHIVGVMPFSSTEDAFMGSKAAIAGLMESLGSVCKENKQLTFITVAPKCQSRFVKQSEQKIASDVVEAVRRDQLFLTRNWCSETFYTISCKLYRGITFITQWLDT
ncbi:estradiol 17-beta-dehydrogenase 11-like isoform X3 [Leptopilina boulardi]|nr:estradiol 17-beta-dehydrogenase 11-like isoform X3 [Leptopilina boulardi]XP_051155728.1 estradiol 17-beta-dehydrogenase 11-like isoform X3 [Leptopilina boulardi]XP_051155729.1 estradiol 17-beta-dehydrogenase 11-like isoform X3 [Leptopilina boulardi]